MQTFDRIIATSLAARDAFRRAPKTAEFLEGKQAEDGDRRTCRHLTAFFAPQASAEQGITRSNNAPERESLPASLDRNPPAGRPPVPEPCRLGMLNGGALLEAAPESTIG